MPAVRDYVQRDMLQLLCCTHTTSTCTRAPWKCAPGSSGLRQGHKPQPGPIQSLVSEGLKRSVGSQQREKSLSSTGRRGNTEMPGQRSEMLKETPFATQELEMCTDIINEEPLQR